MKSTTQRRGFNSATSCTVAAWQWLTFHASLPLTSTTSSWAQSRDTGETPWCSSETWSPSQPRGWKWISHLTVLLRITSLCGRWCSASHFKITAGLNPSLSKTHATGCESKGPSQWSLPTTWEAVDSQRFFWAAKPPQYGLTLSSCSFLLSQYPSNRPDINCTGEAVNVKSNPTLWQRTF